MRTFSAISARAALSWFGGFESGGDLRPTTAELFEILSALSLLGFGVGELAAEVRGALQQRFRTVSGGLLRRGAQEFDAVAGAAGSSLCPSRGLSEPAQQPCEPVAVPPCLRGFSLGGGA